ncbi:MAG: phenylacetate--CoA ligase family protein, partial [Chloroflexi bacterium]|nr:phenylacetate--CoA ligase family protein [Chloroflexota bacterium]
MGKFRIAIDIIRANSASNIQRKQTERLYRLFSEARAHSAYYARLYKGLSERPALSQLPAVTKPELMDHFDDWVTDPGIKKAAVSSFVDDPAKIGRRFLGRYLACRSSGVTGQPGIFVHDRHAETVYRALTIMRGYVPWLRGLVRPCAPWGMRIAAIIVTGGHYAALVWIGMSAGLAPFARRGRLRILSVTDPVPELVGALNEFQPAAIIGYPSALSALALQQRGGRLKISPVVLVTGGESMDREQREMVSRTFGCPVHDTYAASEFFGIAFDCRYGNLHYNSDWLILEPVDAHNNPVPAGQASATVLLTNLANRVQPLLRYDLGDSVTIPGSPCPCGSPLPVVQVEGRRDDVLSFQGEDGVPVRLMPLALGTIAEETPGVKRVQLIQTGPATLRVRFEADDADSVWIGLS